MTDIITGPGNFCRADGVKIKITREGWPGIWVCSGALTYDADGAKRSPENFPSNYNLISTWKDRPDEFRKPKPAYRKDGTSRWPVGTRAVLVAWEDGRSDEIGKTYVATNDDGHMGRDDGVFFAPGNGAFRKGHRPLFCKIKDAVPKPEPRELVLYGELVDGLWMESIYTGHTHRLSLTIIGDKVTGGTLEAL